LDIEGVCNTDASNLFVVATEPHQRMTRSGICGVIDDVCECFLKAISDARRGICHAHRIWR
jgi:hypothetical protein